MNQEQKIIMITGASGGIGRAIAQTCLDNGYKVIGWNHKTNAIEHKNYQAIQCDFKKPELVEQTIKEVLKDLKQINALVLAAGYGQFKELEQFSIEQMQEMMQVNFMSQAIVLKLLLTLIKKTQNSKIIAIVSEAALQGARKGSIYCASKFALRGLMQSLRYECNSADTAVSIINPGLTDTAFFNELNFKPGADKDNSIQPQQIAKTVAMILELDNNCVIEEVTIQPLKKVIQKN